jgi:small subunit ribosomal protein S20
MPVTKTARRALRGSTKKEAVNKLITKNLEIAVRVAKKSKSAEKILKAISLEDRAAKKRTIHKNKASRIKAQLSKFLPRKSDSKNAPKIHRAKSTKSTKKK